MLKTIDKYRYQKVGKEEKKKCIRIVKTTITVNNVSRVIKYERKKQA